MEISLATRRKEPWPASRATASRNSAIGNVGTVWRPAVMRRPEAGLPRYDFRFAGA